MVFLCILWVLRVRHSCFLILRFLTQGLSQIYQCLVRSDQHDAAVLEHADLEVTGLFLVRLFFHVLFSQSREVAKFFYGLIFSLRLRALARFLLSI